MKKNLFIFLLALLSMGAYAQDNNVINKEKSNIDKNELSLVKSNSIAILPVPFVNTQTLASSVDVSKFAQNDIYQELITELSKIQPLTVQDIRTTNSLLKKAGINYENVNDYSIEELQSVLGVDHIISVQVQFTTKASETSNSYGNAKVDGKKVSGSESTYKEENLAYNYKIYFDIYKNGAKIYSKSREPFLKLRNSWIDALHYLLKRSSIYSR